ncbi:MAG: DUF4114 domain-containing protein [Bacteroidota bacterium]
MKNSFYQMLLVIIVSACQTDDPINSIDQSFEKVESEFVINSNSAQLSQRIHLINRTVKMRFNEDYAANGRTSSSSPSQIDFYWHHIASVESPQVSGVKLSATHFEVDDNKAYVSYHKQGDQHLGATEILDLSDPYNPILQSQISFLEADLNALTYKNDGQAKVYLAASNRVHGATVYQVDILGNIFGSQINRMNLSNSLDGAVSASANAIDVLNGKMIVTAGKTFGGTFLIDENTFDVEQVMEQSDAKYAVTTNTLGSDYYVSLITGDVAKLEVGLMSNFMSPQSYNIGSIVHNNVERAYRGKSTMEISPLNSQEVYVSMGADGLKSFDFTNGAILKESKGTMLVAGNTNGVTLDEDFIYIANGADGLAVAEYPESNDIDPVFFWDLEEQPASVNFVKARNDYLFVAKGEGGFHILKKIPKAPYASITTYNSQGTPEGLEDDIVICPELLPTIFSEALPERQNAVASHPEYFEFEKKNITLTEDAEVFVTFLREGAGYKNILGYYAYEADDEPQSEDELDKVVIFPNASAERSGGELIPGNTMKLLGSFEAGMTIGFFLISNGWKGKITDGIYTQHTNQEFNVNEKQQSLIFHSPGCNATVICFEDIVVPNGDNDFNDAIFQISTNPPNAIDPLEYIQIGLE